MLLLVSAVNSLKCISMKNQKCKVREIVVNNECLTYPYSIKVNRFNDNCNSITNPYSRVYIANIVKKITVKVFDVMSLKDKTKQVKWCESCECLCVDYIQLFVTINKNRTERDADVNV